MGACWSAPQVRREAAVAGGSTDQPVAAAGPAAPALVEQPAATTAPLEALHDSKNGPQGSPLVDSPLLVSEVSVTVAPAAPDLTPSSSGPTVIVTPHETERLQALRALNVLNCPHERFSTITRLIKELFNVPLAAVVAIDEVLHVISPQGDMSYKEGAPRALSFCQWVLAGDSPTVLVVEDALKDKRFKDTPHVAGPPHIRFFAGAPLISSNGGHRFGSLAIMDFRPRQFQASQLVLLAHFAELTVREMEQELALKWQQQALDRQQATQLHLVRALDCFHEGVLLLDVVGPQWRMVWCNEAFRSLAGMPKLLMGAGGSAASGPTGAMQRHSQDTAANGRGPGVPEGTDFWQLFHHVPDVSPGSYNATLQALREGRDFTLRLQPSPTALASRQGSSSSDGGSGSGSSSGSGSTPRPPLTLLFRPAESDQLLPGEQVIGIPAMPVRLSCGFSSNGSEADQPDYKRCSAELQPGTPNSGIDRPAARALPLYYFAIVQKQPQEPVGTTAALAERPLADPRSRSSIEVPLYDDLPSMAFRSFDGVTMGLPSVVTASGRQQLSWPGSDRALGSLDGGTPLGPTAGPGAGTFPMSAFYRLRPDVMKEVTLGTLIGTGSMGRCYRGMWQGGRVAVKIIDCVSDADSGSGSSVAASTELPAGASDSGRAMSGSNGLSNKRPARGMCAQAAMVEALLARSMGHPHIVTTFAHGVGVEEQVEGGGSSHQQVWIVQEFCNRGSLFEAVDRGMLQLPGGGGPDLRAVLATAQEIAGALTYLHSHDVLHGDLTPSNVLLTSSTKDGRRWQAKVNDFGLAAVMGGADAVRRSCRLGTVTHMPPEIVQHGTLSKATDVWSFGMIMLEMLTGQRAWMGLHYGQIIQQVGQGQLPMSIPTDIPPRLASLVRRCLNREPSDRPDFPTILSEVQQLKDSLISRPPSQESSRPELSSPPSQQRPSGRQPQLPPQPQQQPLSAEEREQQKERQRQLIREHEKWLALEPGATPAKGSPMVVLPHTRAPSLPSPFAAALAPAPSMPSPFSAAPDPAPSLPYPAGAK